jgi:hypothetical protein
MTYADEWGHVYNAAVTQFSKDIAKATKTGRDLGSAVGGVLEHAKKGTAGMVQALVQIDKLPDSGSLRTDKERQQWVASLGSQLKTLSAEAKKYVALLDTAINGDIKVGFNHPVKVKDQIPDSYRHLKILRTEVLSIEARLASVYQGKKTEKEKIKISGQGQKAYTKAVDGDNKSHLEGKAIQDAINVKSFLLTLGSQYRSAMAKGAAVIQKLKASPDLATYNALMPRGGRDVGQVIVNIAKMHENPSVRDLGIKGVDKVPHPGAELARTAAIFANDGTPGSLRTLPPEATAADVQTALARYTAFYKEVATAYGGLAKLK